MQPQPNASRGWFITGTAVCINLVLGVLYAWSVVGKALVGQWHWTKFQASLPFMASTIAFSLMMVPAGRLQDKIGPRKIAVLGGVMLGLGMILSAWAHSPAMMILTFGVVGGVGIGLGYAATTPPCLKWFPPAKKGLIAGVVVSGIGLAAIVWAPVTQGLLKSSTIGHTFIVLGVITIVVVSLLATQLVNPPAGFTPAAAPAAGGAPRPAASAPRREIDWPEMLSTLTFWKIWLILILSASAGLMFISQATMIAKMQAGIENGFYLVMLVAAFNTSGRLVGGFFSDLIGRTRTMILFFILQAIGMFVFRAYTTPALLIFGTAFTGVCYGTIFPLFPAVTADYYGIRNLGVNYGFVFTAFGVAGTVGPLLASRIADKFQSFNLAYIICGVMLLAAAVLAMTLQPPVAAAAAPESDATSEKRVAAGRA